MARYIRQTKTSNSLTGEDYHTFRLVASKRTGGKVRQQTLLNLGRNLDLPQEEWPKLCARIELIILASAGLNGVLQAAAIGSIIGRMARKCDSSVIQKSGKRRKRP